jgi:hypothetical protein
MYMCVSEIYAKVNGGVPGARRASALVERGLGHVDEPKGMRRHQTLGHHRAGARGKDLHEGAAVEPAHPA